jgi:hypothetical protein
MLTVRSPPNPILEHLSPAEVLTLIYSDLFARLKDAGYADPGARLMELMAPGVNENLGELLRQMLKQYDGYMRNLLADASSSRS